MARILIGTVPVAGHVAPLLRVAAELVMRGHEVAWLTGRRHHEKVRAVGARFIPYAATRDWDDSRMDQEFPRLAQLAGLAQIKEGVKRAFLDPIPDQVKDLRALLATFPADVLVCDPCFYGAPIIGELAGFPVAFLSVIPLPLKGADLPPYGLGLAPMAGFLGRLRNRFLQLLVDKIAMHDVNGHYDAMRAQVGLAKGPWGAFGYSPQLRFRFMQPSVPSFEYASSTIPPEVRFIGPILPQAPKDFRLPAWWDGMLTKGAPVVHVTQGTVAHDYRKLLLPALEALDGMQAQVIATTGAKPPEALGLATLPANVRVERFIPYKVLLPHVDVMVTNGGYGGTTQALAHGVPLVSAGTTEDKMEVNRRVAWSGVGIDLRTDWPKPAAIREAVGRVIAEPSFRRRAEAIRDEMRQYDAPRLAAATIEGLIAGSDALPA